MAILKLLLIPLILSPFAYAVEVTDIQLEIDFANALTPMTEECQSCAGQIEPSLIERFPAKIEKIKQMLAVDDTESVSYELRRFSCHDYAKRLYLQNSNQVDSLDPYNIENLSENWGGVAVTRGSEPKFEMYYLTIASAEEGYFHAINAVLIDEANPGDIESYIFIEPQTDKLIEAKNLRSHSSRLMRKDIVKPLAIEVRTFDKYSFNGNIWQSSSSVKQSFIQN